MRSLDKIRHRLRSLFRKSQVEQELTNELQFHLEQQIQENIQAGMSLEAARHAAIRATGNVARLQEDCRETRAVGFLDELLRNLRLAARTLRKNPGFTCIAVITLALGIGANTAVFSLIRAVILQPLAYGNPDRLVIVWQGNDPGETTWISLQEVISYGQDAKTLEQLAASSDVNANFTGGQEPERVHASAVTSNLFDTLQVPALLGRTLLERDSRPGADPVVVLGYGLWQRRFGGRSDVIGQEVFINGVARTVVGVMPESFRLPTDYRVSNPTEAWMPIEIDPANLGQWGNRSYIGIARLKDGVVASTASSELAVISDRWIQAGFVQNPLGTLNRNAIPLQDFITGSVRTPLLILFGSVAFVLLISCANVANLLLAKADVRRREIAVCAALGAGRGPIARQLLTESVALALVGGMVGLVLAQVATTLLRAVPMTTIPRSDTVGIDAGALAFAAITAIVTGVLFGLVPALQVSRNDLASVLQDGGRTGTAGRSRRMFRRGLVITQIAFSVVLVVGAGLLIRSLIELYRIELGFNPGNILTAQLQVPVTDYSKPADVVRFYRDLEARLQDLPGVTDAGAIRVLPLARTIGDWSIVIEGQPLVPGENPNGDYQAATPGYFAAMGIRPVRGRVFTNGDHENAPLVAVINETMADRYWPGEDAIGKRFHMSTDDRPWLTIVGIIRGIRHNAVVEAPRAEMYVPHSQFPLEIGNTPRAMTLVIKTEGDPTATVESLRSVVRSLDRNLPIADIRTMEEVTAEAVAQPRFMAFLLGLFAVIALALAAVGVYGTISLLVAERSQEIGIRLTLGARPATILTMIMREGLLLSTAGLLFGVTGAVFLTRLLSGLLYGVNALDLVTFATVPGVLSVVAILASLIPALRAASIDPAETLRGT